MKRAEAALQKVLSQMVQDERVAPGDYLELYSLLKDPCQCRTASGYVTELDPLVEMRSVKSPSSLACERDPQCSYLVWRTSQSLDALVTAPFLRILAGMWLHWLTLWGSDWRSTSRRS